MKRTFLALSILLPFIAFSQPRIKTKNYPSLLWEISGNGMQKKSYLFGTMHVSSKIAFNLSDSFYLGIRRADVVALETNPESWQEDMNNYDLSQGRYASDYTAAPGDYFRQSTLRFYKYDKKIERALYSNPSTINNLLYRSYGDRSSDFEEDTYLDMYIYQCGKKWGKQVAGVENYEESMKLMAEAYKDAAKEKVRKERSYDYNDAYGNNKLQEAYRSGNLDWLDSINKYNSTSAAFDEKFLYKRNDIQAYSIDSILKTGYSLFVGVGAAHLPGERGVIEILRRAGYTLRPIAMGMRDSQQKSIVEKLRVPVVFSTQQSEDGFYKVDIPGKLYRFDEETGFDQGQYSDMANGSYYMVTRIMTNAWLWGHTMTQVEKKVDSLLYENIPGKILTKKRITRNGYNGIDIVNKTRRGDIQRYNIFITPFEVIVFKMSGTGEYVNKGDEAKRFFESIQLKEYVPQNTMTANWKSFSPVHGGFSVLFPHQPYIGNDGSWIYDAEDKSTETKYRLIRTDIHNYNFAEEDSFDLNLLHESFLASEFVDKPVQKTLHTWKGYPALDANYKDKQGNNLLARYIIQGPHYYTLVAQGKEITPRMKEFINSFEIKPYLYPTATVYTDTSLYFTTQSPVRIKKDKEKLDIPQYGYGRVADDEDDPMITGMFRSKIVGNDTTGEKIFVSFFKTNRYYQLKDSSLLEKEERGMFGDTTWIVRSKKRYDLPNNMKVWEYALSDTGSSRMLFTKTFYKDGIGYLLATQTDTLTAPSTFIKSFFENFKPADTLKGSNPLTRKTALFFEDFHSKDSVVHKRAVKSIYQLKFDADDLPELKKIINTLSWEEKNYLDTKKSLISRLDNISTKEAADYVKSLYYTAGDTLELQYAALSVLLAQQTNYSYALFKDIMVADPPILSLESKTSNRNYNYDYSSSSVTGRYFMNDLQDSLKLTRTIFPSILPLINLSDYEMNVMELTSTLIDSGLVKPKEYQAYHDKLLIEAKQELKKQLIREKQKAITKAEEVKEESSYSSSYLRTETDPGNEKLELYARLLIPFWQKNKPVQELLTKMLSVQDKELKLTTAILLLKNNQPVPDTLFTYLASLDMYRYKLYTELQKINQEKLFPAIYRNHIDLGRSKLIALSSSYNRPDSVHYVDRLPATIKDKKGFVYFFKYKVKKDDAGWKLATVGLVPEDPMLIDWKKSTVAKTRYAYDNDYEYDYESYSYGKKGYDNTSFSQIKLKDDEPLADQLARQLKRFLYSFRKSARMFFDIYETEEGLENDGYAAELDVDAVFVPNPAM